MAALLLVSPALKLLRHWRRRPRPVPGLVALCLSLGLTVVLVICVVGRDLPQASSDNIGHMALLWGLRLAFTHFIHGPIDRYLSLGLIANLGFPGHDLSQASLKTLVIGISLAIDPAGPDLAEIPLSYICHAALLSSLLLSLSCYHPTK